MYVYLSAIFYEGYLYYGDSILDKLNPFKIISNIENEIVEFKKMNIEDAILAIFIYVIILVFSGVLFRKNSNSLLKMLIFNSIIAIVKC